MIKISLSLHVLYRVLYLYIPSMYVQYIHTVLCIVLVPSMYNTIQLTSYKAEVKLGWKLKIIEFCFSEITKFKNKILCGSKLPIPYRNTISYKKNLLIVLASGKAYYRHGMRLLYYILIFGTVLFCEAGSCLSDVVMYVM